MRVIILKWVCFFSDFCNTCFAHSPIFICNLPARETHTRKKLLLFIKARTFFSMENKLWWKERSMCLPLGILSLCLRGRTPSDHGATNKGGSGGGLYKMFNFDPLTIMAHSPDAKVSVLKSLVRVLTDSPLSDALIALSKYPRNCEVLITSISKSNTLRIPA